MMKDDAVVAKLLNEATFSCAVTETIKRTFLDFFSNLHTKLANFIKPELTLAIQLDRMCRFVTIEYELEEYVGENLTVDNFVREESKLDGLDSDFVLDAKCYFINIYFNEECITATYNDSKGNCVYQAVKDLHIDDDSTEKIRVKLSVSPHLKKVELSDLVYQNLTFPSHSVESYALIENFLLISLHYEISLYLHVDNEIKTFGTGKKYHFKLSDEHVTAMTQSMCMLIARICTNTIKNWLDCELFTLKAIRPMPINVNSPENKLKRVDYVNSLLLARSNGRTIILINESNFNLFCIRKEGRSKVGCRSTVITAGSKGSNIHCIAAMSASRIFNFKTHRGSFKGDDCNDWFRSLIDECTEIGVISPTFVIDNAPVHSKLESVIRIRLAPYSHLLNPIELAWSCFKNEVNIKLRDEMSQMIAYRRINGVSICEFRMRILEIISNEAIHVLTLQKLLHFCNHVERYYGAVRRGEDLHE
ncbi:hypothetical protein A3Q56_06079 [Intoshia linei]|uniref:Tc1-like transposase DDE domain-containing protein n=1 Tax=Intoshia linei TaxID=1819745 RepID=A0A177AVY0_9BILA|nr:hypothetical protein A3Q56_06079 [Intoshia linei]